jgi:hypothetical protein
MRFAGDFEFFYAFTANRASPHSLGLGLACWFHAKGEISSGVVEGFKGETKLSIRKAYSLRTTEGIKIALFHTLGRLPEPEGTHRFC